MTSASTPGGQRNTDRAAVPVPERIRHLALAFRESRVLLSAIELGVFTELSTNGPGTAGALGVRLGVHPRGARDFFDTLVALDLLDRDEDGAYSNTEESELFLVRGKPTYQGLLEMAAQRVYPFWAQLTDALRTGQPQNDVAEAGLYPAVYGDDDKRRAFVGAMTDFSTRSGRVLAERLPWERYHTVADIGCSQGALLAELAVRHPHLTGVGFDLPPVQGLFAELTRERGVADRVTFTPGDFFTDELPPADVIVFGHVLHNWDLDTKRMLLAKAHRALPESGTVVVYEALIDDERRTNWFAMLMSLNMLLQTEGGFDFTAADCRGWLAEAGFQESWVAPLAGADQMVVATK